MQQNTYHMSLALFFTLLNKERLRMLWNTPLCTYYSVLPLYMLASYTVLSIFFRIGRNLIFFWMQKIIMVLEKQSVEIVLLSPQRILYLWWTQTSIIPSGKLLNPSLIKGLLYFFLLLRNFTVDKLFEEGGGRNKLCYFTYILSDKLIALYVFEPTWTFSLLVSEWQTSLHCLPN